MGFVDAIVWFGSSFEEPFMWFCGLFFNYLGCFLLPLYCVIHLSNEHSEALSFTWMMESQILKLLPTFKAYSRNFEWCLNVLLRWTHFFIGQGEKCSCFILDYLQREKYKNFLRFWSIKFWRWKACSLVLDWKRLPNWLVPWPIEPIDQFFNQFTYFGSKTCHFSIHLISNT